MAENFKRPLEFAQKSLTCGLPGCILNQVVKQNYIFW